MQLCTFLSSVAEILKLFDNLNSQKVQRALENLLAGTFLPPGSGLATPGLEHTQLLVKVASIVYTCSSVDEN